MNYLYKNKKGWIKVVEAFVAILLITGIILVILNKGYIQKEDSSKDIYEIENSILKEIQTDDSLRNDILSSNVPSEGNNVPVSIRNKITGEEPNYLDCQAKICSLDDACTLSSFEEKDVYANSVVISSNSTVYNPRQLKLFCSFKEN